MAVRLDRYDEQLLNGDKGEAAKIAMEIIVSLADAFGAKELVSIASVQAMAHYGSLHDAGLEWLERLASLGGQCCVPCTQDPASISFKHWRLLGIPEDYAAKQIRMAEAVLKLGELHSWSCTPYYVGSVPRYGQNVAWAESSAVSFANSVLGARTNRTPAGLAVCAALTGRMPKIGLYLDENRVGSVLVKIDAGGLSDLDYNTIGYILGKIAGTDVPVLDGIPASATNDNLKYLGAAAATSGSVGLYHVLGVTPEALHADPFKGRKPSREQVITRKDIRAMQDALTTPNAGDVDLVVFGCPHYSIQEIAGLARLVRGKRVKSDRRVWVYTSAEVENLADRMGYLKVLNDAGVTVLSQNCLVISPLCVKGVRTLATDSAKFAGYLPSEHGIEMVYASTEECIAAVTE